MAILGARKKARKYLRATGQDGQRDRCHEAHRGAVCHGSLRADPHGCRDRDGDGGVGVSGGVDKPDAVVDSDESGVNAFVGVVNSAH